MSAKAMIFLKRREGLSREAFRTWWLTSHRALAERLPGLRHHAFNLLDEGGPFDAVVEQWFGTHAEMNACYATDAGRLVAADSGAHTSLRIRSVVEESAFEVGASVLAAGT